MLHKTLKISEESKKEVKTVPLSQTYIQRLMSIPKTIVTSSAYFLAKQNISGLMKLIVGMDFLSYLPKADADQLYVLFDKINYALTFDKHGQLDTLTNHLMDACKNLTILNSPQCNYTDFFSTGCTSLNGDAHLTMSIETGNNNTQALLNCTFDLVNKIDSFCDQDKFIKGVLIFIACLVAFACLAACLVSIKSNNKIAPDKSRETQLTELKHSASSPAQIETSIETKPMVLTAPPAYEEIAAEAKERIIPSAPSADKEEAAFNETDTLKPKIINARPNSFLNEFTTKPSSPPHDSSENVTTPDLSAEPGYETRISMIKH